VRIAVEGPTQLTAMFASTNSAAMPWVNRCSAAFIDAYTTSPAVLL